MFFVMGMCALFLVYMMNITMEKGNTAQLDEVEDQLAALRKELQKTQLEREELDRRLPVHSGDPEMRLRDMEETVQALEGLLPMQQNLEAVRQRHQAARQRAAQAAESLRAAKSGWRKTLQHFGLAENLSPKSIRLLADGYDSLLQTRRRLTGLVEELESRQFELGAITQRIDALARQVFAAKAASDAIAGQDRPAGGERAAGKSDFAAAIKADVDLGNRALEQLAKMSELLSSQEQFILQKRQLREQDHELAAQASKLEKSLDKLHRGHSAVLAEHGCESEEQLLQQLEAKHEYLKLDQEQAAYAQRIQEMIGGSVPFDSILRLLESSTADELTKRREAIGQRTQQATLRMEQLHQRQGELNQR